MDKLEAMRIYSRVVELRSFTAVANERDVTQSSISKKVAQLEAELGARLLNRSTRLVRTTLEGERYYHETKAILGSLEDVESRLHGRTKPVGRLNIACPLTFGHLHLMPRLPRFLDMHPDVDVALQMSDEFIDLIEGGVDVAIRAGQLDDSSLVARRIGSSRWSLLASPEYLERRGTPRSLADLVHHDCVLYSGLRGSNEWEFVGPEGPVRVRVKVRVQVNSTLETRVPIISGHGIGLVPSWLFGNELDSGEVVPILEQYERPIMPIYAVYPSRHYVPGRVNAFIDFLSAELAKVVELAPR